MTGGVGAGARRRDVLRRHAVALVDPAGNVVAAATASQVALHNRYGGVYPEMASRAHVDKILPTVRMVLEDSGVDPRELRAIGVTRGPGLIGSLMVGVSTAAGLGQGWDVPVLGINHLRGHLRSADLEERRVDYPAIILLVSGGHTFLARMTARHDHAARLDRGRLGRGGVRQGRADARPRLPRRPGGGQARATGNPVSRSPRPMLTYGLNFSFSGLKSAVDAVPRRHPDAPRPTWPRASSRPAGGAGGQVPAGAGPSTVGSAW